MKKGDYFFFFWQVTPRRRLKHIYSDTQGGQGPQEEGRSAQIRASIQTAVCDAGLPPENKTRCTWTRISSLWQGHIDRGLKNSLIHVKVEQNHFSRIIGMLRVATVFGFTAPGSSVVCLKYAPSPSASYLSSDFYFIFFKCCCICMRTRLCIIAFRRGFLWGTSLGSKPCSDSCLVNHLNKFSNKVPTSVVKKKKKSPLGAARLSTGPRLQNSASTTRAWLCKLLCPPRTGD